MGATWDQDVFINVVGGVKFLRPALIWLLLLAMASSFRNKVLPESLIVLVSWIIWGDPPGSNGQQN